MHSFHTIEGSHEIRSVRCMQGKVISGHTVKDLYNYVPKEIKVKAQRTLLDFLRINSHSSLSVNYSSTCKKISH